MITLKDYVFEGTSPDFVFIVAGIHNSEQSGIEIAQWIRVKLANRPKPTLFGAIVIPEAFPVDARKARTDEWKTGSAAKWREVVDGKEVFPARHFPPPGRSEAFLGDGFLKDRQGKNLPSKRKQLANIAYLTLYIEKVQPKRIVSIHGRRPRDSDDLRIAAGFLVNGRKRPKVINMTEDEISKWDGKTPIAGVNFPGIYVDPRYDPSPCKGFELESCKLDPELDPAFPLQGTTANKRFDSAINTFAGREDDALALETAKAVAAADPTLVVGNHLNGPSPVPIVHYAKEGDTPQAFSLGDWGPVDGEKLARLGAPVFTIETKDDNQSWAFIDGEQVMNEDGTTPLMSEPEPAARAVGQRGRPLPRPAKFNASRSKELQAYAEAIIKTILERP
jgi:hypothetical protein